MSDQVLATTHNPTMTGKPAFGDVFAYPFRGSGPMIILMGGILLAFRHFAPLFVLIGGIFICGYIQLYFFDVISTSADGKANPPDWPDISDKHDMISATIMTFLIILFSFTPHIIYVFFCFYSKLPPDKTIMIALCLWSAIYYPMALFLVAETRNALASLPHAVIAAIFQAPPRYYLLPLSLLVLAIPYFATGMMSGLTAGGFGLKIIAGFIFYLISFYANMVLCRILGMFFRDLIK